MAFLDILLAVVLVAIVGVLIFGVVSMGKGGEKGRERSNKMMRWRVGLQFAAVIVVVLIMLLRG